VAAAAPLKTDGDFTAQPTEAWGNEITPEAVPRSWAEEVPAPAPVPGATAPPVPYSTSDDWATQVSVLFSLVTGHKFFFYFPLYLQSVPIHSAKVVKSCTKACRRVLTSTLLYLIGSESSCDLGSVTYKLNFKNYIYNYRIYI
jgi:hypothetical protein